MPDHRNKLGKWKFPLVITLFILLLTGSRLLWMTSFNSVDHAKSVRGVMDLRDWNARQGGTILLDGDWEFYPHEWLFGQTSYERPLSDNSQFIQVPGSWNQALQPGKDSPFGYGTYRLTVLVNPDHDLNYSIRTASIRSAYTLYIDGRKLAQSGETGENGKNYVARNVPFTATFAASSSGVIEVVIQVANHVDVRKSGIVHSLTFGSELAIEQKQMLAISMQMLDVVVFSMQAIYAIILYLVGNRDKRPLYFALLAVSIMLNNLLVNDDKFLQHLLHFNYDWSFRLAHLSTMGIIYGLLRSGKQQMQFYWPRAYQWYTSFCTVDVIVALFLPLRYLLIYHPIVLVLMASSVFLTLTSIIRASLKNLKENIPLVLSLIALMNHFVWLILSFAVGFKMDFYPFDLIIATTYFASLWFRQYFKIYAETGMLAAKLQRTDKLKDEFLANTSHELRNPLHGILNISQSILEREQHVLTEKSIKDLGTVLSVGRRMSLMLRDLIDAKRLQEGTPQLNLRNVSLHAVTTGVLDMLVFMTAGKSVRLVNDIPEFFPDVHADENRVIQIVFNLLHNAVKFTNEGEIVISVSVREGWAHIVISDSGIGMDEETMRRVLEPYEQGELGKTMVEGGFGLGLSITKQLIELHGGTLQISSKPDQGSEFVFTLPLSQGATPIGDKAAEIFASEALINATVPDARTLPAQVSVQPLKKYMDRPRILIVDDDPVNLQVLEAILSLEQYDIVTVTSGKQALALLKTREWDLVISDVMMPQMSGYELARSIRQHFTLTELPILLLTARSYPKDIENGFLSGANDYVTKPVESLEIRSRVRALTEVRQSVRQRLEMEAAWLQAQIQPHFLFNTLNAISALSEIDLVRMRNLLEALSSFLRDKFKLQNMNQLVPIEEELSIVRSYLFIEQERFEERLHVVWELGECKELRIPMLTIQPLVENAIRHGLMKRARGGSICIRVLNEESYAEITVQDDGVGMDEDMLRQLSGGHPGDRPGVGLYNTDLRLKRQYGEGLRIQSKLGHGTSVSFIIHK
ncbi:ATP-binding protein [Paenibacillus sp. GCM10012306]|uniref:hybrid sensor histidine kinase/response regulator n=1 Tax=Paenibacillus sp. GCM10012306 TaxID=3317342 RepID=UPI003613F380